MTVKDKLIIENNILYDGLAIIFIESVFFFSFVIYSFFYWHNISYIISRILKQIFLK